MDWHRLTTTEAAERLGVELLVIALAATVSPVLELAKWLERRGWFGRMD